MVTPVDEETTYGNVVYCERLADGRFGIGLKFQDRIVMWSAMRRYDGIQFSPQPDQSKENITGILSKQAIKRPV
jgi:hypothetical protein